VYDVLDRPAYTARTVLHRLGNQVYSGRDEPVSNLVEIGRPSVCLL
jgi:hypothetical protein